MHRQVLTPQAFSCLIRELINWCEISQNIYYFCMQENTFRLVWCCHLMTRHIMKQTEISRSTCTFYRYLTTQHFHKIVYLRNQDIWRLFGSDVNVTDINVT